VPTSAPGGGRGFDLLALQEAISLATAASSLRFGPPPPPPPPAVTELLHYGPGLRGFTSPVSSACGPSRPPAWVFPSSAGRYDLPGQQLEVKAAGFASHPIRNGK